MSILTQSDMYWQVGKLEQRLLSLQTAHALRCSTCRPLLTRLTQLERRLTQLLDERADHLQELTQMKYDSCLIGLICFHYHSTKVIQKLT